MNINQIYNEDCQEGIKRIPDASIDCILTDPPYLYLKGQKLEREFNEQSLFTEFKRVLKPTGFVILFGRGTSFYRWNTILSGLGFEFKEEIVWNKCNSTSPLHSLSRFHETISLHTISGTVKRSKIPYLEMKRDDIPAIVTDMKRVRVAMKNSSVLDGIISYLQNGVVYNDKFHVDKHLTSIQPGVKQIDRSVAVVKMVKEGCNERSIIKELAPRYSSIHPTEKPVRLLERLLMLVTQPEDVVLDPFSGSCSTAAACINTGRHYIGFEIDKEYYEAGIKRLKEVLSEPKLAM